MVSNTFFFKLGNNKSLSSSEKLLYYSKLKAFQNLKMSPKLSGAQNDLSASASGRSWKNWAWVWARARILRLSASAAKTFERTKALDWCLILKVMSSFWSQRTYLNQTWITIELEIDSSFTQGRTVIDLQ